MYMPRTPAGTGPSIVLSHEPLPPGESLHGHATKSLAVMARSLDDYELLDLRELSIYGQPALDAAFTWSGEDGTVAQRQICVSAGERIYLITATAKGSSWEELDPVVTMMLATLRFDAQGGD